MSILKLYINKVKIIFTLRPTQLVNSLSDLSSISTPLQTEWTHDPPSTANNPEVYLWKKGHRLTMCVCVCYELCCDVIHMKHKHTMQRLRAIEKKERERWRGEGWGGRGRHRGERWHRGPGLKYKGVSLEDTWVGKQPHSIYYLISDWY